jgi:hypothetical protein
MKGRLWGMVLVVLGVVALLVHLYTAHESALMGWALLWAGAWFVLEATDPGCRSMYEEESTLWMCQRRAGHLGLHRSVGGRAWSDSEAAPPDRIKDYVTYCGPPRWRAFSFPERRWAMPEIPRVICGACNVQMFPLKNGRRLHVHTDNPDEPAPEPYYKITYDRWGCGRCGASVYVGHGEPMALHFEPDYDRVRTDVDVRLARRRFDEAWPEEVEETSKMLTELAARRHGPLRPFREPVEV